MPPPTSRARYAIFAALALIAATAATAVLAVSRAGATPRAMATARAAGGSLFSFTAGVQPTAAQPPSRPSPAGKPVRVRLTASSQAGLPVAGHGYQFYVGITNLAHPPDWDLRLFAGFSAGLTLAGGAPPGCFAVPGGLFCGYERLAGEDSISLTINVSVAPRLRTGSEVGISASLHYDEEFSAFASVYRPVLTPTPTPTPTRTRRPPPTRTPTPPHHSRPGPPPPTPSPPGKPVPPASHPAVAPHPGKPHPTPRPRPPEPAPVAFSVNPKRPAASAAVAPHPVIPIGVLLAVVLTPCVAAAATRFGKSIHHR
jgi:hypothetical protein